MEPRAASGSSTTPPAPGRRRRKTWSPWRSARLRSLRRTTRHLRRARAKAPCPATATSVTASSSRPTAGHWSHVSGDYFLGVSISRLVVDPTNASHVYAAVLRGRGGARRVSPPSTRATESGSPLTAASTGRCVRRCPRNGATDLEIDPQNPKILYARFWSDKIYKSTDGGAHWTPIMTGLPDADYAAETTRFSIAISHPSRTGPASCTPASGTTDGGTRTSTSRPTAAGKLEHLLAGRERCDDSVYDYCAEQCSYDNVIEADPHNPNIVFAARPVRLRRSARAAIFRSNDGGQTWKNLGWDQHPDFHAFAFDPNDSASVSSATTAASGSARTSADARPLPPRSTTATGIGSTAAASRSAQFTSIATNPPGRTRARTVRRASGVGRRTTGHCASRLRRTCWFDDAERRRRAGARRPDQFELRVRHLLRRVSPYR